MDLVLQRVNINLLSGRTTSEDLFDSKGTLLLKKGIQLTESIWKYVTNREVYVLQYHEDYTGSKKVNRFRKDTYIELVGSIWSIYHEARIIEPEHIEKTVKLVQVILKGLQSPNIYLDLNESRVSFEKLKQHDTWTFVHVVNVAILTALTGIKLGYNGKRLENLTLGALLHDLGKVKIPSEILNKPGSLTDEEYSVIKRHPTLGWELLEGNRTLKNVQAIITQHHERWNGKGYPRGLKKNEINTDAQIVAVADVFEALTADRPYRKGLPPYHALEMIIAWSGQDFNPAVVQAFRKSLILYPDNAVVTLNTGETGLISAVPTQMPTRPLVRLLFDKNRRYLNKELYIDLMQDLTRFIERVEFMDAIEE